jgi:hypothetical protein
MGVCRKGEGRVRRGEKGTKKRQVEAGAGLGGPPAPPTPACTHGKGGPITPGPPSHGWRGGAGAGPGRWGAGGGRGHGHRQDGVTGCSPRSLPSPPPPPPVSAREQAASAPALAVSGTSVTLARTWGSGKSGWGDAEGRADRRKGGEVYGGIKNGCLARAFGISRFSLPHSLAPPPPPRRLPHPPPAHATPSPACLTRRSCVSLDVPASPASDRAPALPGTRRKKKDAPAAFGRPPRRPCPRRGLSPSRPPAPVRADPAPTSTAYRTAD